MEGADGVKTGYTKAAGRILVSSATRNGRRLICVTLNDPNDWQDHAALLEKGFSCFEMRQVVKKDDVIATLDVAGSDSQQVQILAAEDFSYALSENEHPQLMLSGPGFVYAPVTEGADAGFAYVLIEGNAVAKIPVVYGQTVEQKKEEKKPLWQILFGGKKNEGTASENTVRPGDCLPTES